jgi:hypothetical protein
VLSRGVGCPPAVQYNAATGAVECCSRSCWVLLQGLRVLLQGLQDAAPGASGSCSGAVGRFSNDQGAVSGTDLLVFYCTPSCTHPQNLYTPPP